MQTCLTRLLVVAFCLSNAPFVVAQTDPKIPGLIRIVVPFSPGGSNDVIARAIGPLLAKKLGSTVVIENKPGASGIIGGEAVAKGTPDGSVLLLTSSSLLTAAATLPKMPYDVSRAFSPVAMVASGPLLLVVPATAPYKTPADLVATAKARPGALTYGTAGVGSVAQLATEMMSDAAKISLLHVPYKGAANALIDLSGGQIDIMVTNYSSVVSQIKAGRIKALGITSKQPSPSFPDLPSLSSAAPGFAIDIWVGVLAPAGTPAALVQRLNQDINEIASSPELRKLLDPDGAIPSPMSPTAFGLRMAEDLSVWKKIASDKKIVAE